jgi:hypothetical protein
VHPASVALVAQQLSVLETGQITWHGELWPGQSLFWQIVREDSSEDTRGSGQGGSETDAPKWRTRLALDFPGLGSISAQLALRGNAVWVTIDAADPATRQKLGAAVPVLAGALSSAGLTVQQLQTEHERTLHG